jgi:hypothetical protein
LAGSSSSITGAASTAVRDNLDKNVVFVSNNKEKQQHPMCQLVVYNQ